MSALVTITTERSAELDRAADAARTFASAARAANTMRAYRTDWADFTDWCDRHQLAALPATAETVVLYISELALSARYSTVHRRISALSVVFQAAEVDNAARGPLVQTTLAGIRRTFGVASRQVAPVLVEDLRAMVEALPDSLAGTRDRALLLVGFSAALRRSELVALNGDDLVEVSQGMVITIRRSKSDQDGVGRDIAVPFGSRSTTCPVRALREWRDAADLSDGPLFRSIDRHGNIGERLTAASVALIVKRCAERVGLDSAAYSGHSLRAGLATSAAAADVSERVIAETTGHRSMQTLRRYIRIGGLFHDVASSHVGL
jgi:site-specific recombinase XerD